MDVSALMSAIGSLGFPIAMCVMLFYYLQSESKAHKEEVSSLKDAITDLRVTLAELNTSIKRDRTE